MSCIILLFFLSCHCKPCWNGLVCFYDIDFSEKFDCKKLRYILPASEWQVKCPVSGPVWPLCGSKAQPNSPLCPILAFDFTCDVAVFPSALQSPMGQEMGSYSSGLVGPGLDSSDFCCGNEWSEWSERWAWMWFTEDFLCVYASQKEWSVTVPRRERRKVTLVWASTLLNPLVRGVLGSSSLWVEN